MHDAAFDLKPNEWATLRQLLDQLLAQPAADRGAWIDRLDRANQPYASRLRALLPHAEDSAIGAILQTLPKIETADLASPAAAAHATPQRDAQVGPYRLLHPLGSGGMADVWLAERDDQLQRRRVALKLPRVAWHRSAWAARLAREREILASLEHPHIARLYEAGVSADGQPYLALEYVEGVSIDEHCRERALGVRERLALFLQVAQAVAYAHAKLVVHRDLKPTNILVTAESQVRLLDFGIAKLLDHGSAEETELTRDSGRPLTLRYAAPEQLRGEPIGTAADVYALGVVLYELLTGQGPYRPRLRGSRAALGQAVLHEPPLRPSTVATHARTRRLLRGDLDTIVCKALKKSPAERYPSVDALAEDIRRHLSRQPVLARPDSTAYRVSRFVARHALAVGASAAVAGALLAGTGVAAWQAREARAAQARAEQVKNFIASVFSDADPLSAGKAPSAANMLQQAHVRIDNAFADDPALQVELRNILGRSLLSLGDVAAAEPIGRRALQLARDHLPATHPQALKAALLAAEVHRHQGRTQEMRAELARALPLLRQSQGEPTDLVHALVTQAMLELEEGRHDHSVPTATEAVALAMRRLGDLHPATVDTSITLAYAHVYAGQHAPGLAAAKEAYRRARALHGSSLEHPGVMRAHALLGRALALAGDLRSGIETLKQAQAAAERQFGASSLDAGIHSQGLVLFQIDHGEIHEAIANAQRGHRIVAQHVKPASYSNARGLLGIGAAFNAARRGAEALAALNEAHAAFRAVGMPTPPPRVEAQRALALAYLGRTETAIEVLAPVVPAARASTDPTKPGVLHAAGVVMRLAGRHSEALQLQQETLLAARADPRHKLFSLRALTELGLNQLALDRRAEAAASLRQALELAPEVEAKVTPTRADAMLGMARVLLADGEAAQALPLLRETHAFWQAFDAGNPSAVETRQWLGRCQAALGASTH